MQLRGSLRKYAKGGDDIHVLINDFLSYTEARGITLNIPAVKA